MESTTKSEVWLDFHINLEDLGPDNELILEYPGTDNQSPSGISIKLASTVEPFEECKVYHLVVDYRLGPKRLELIGREK